MKRLLLSIASWLIFLNSFSQIPTDGLVGYWPFNGNANDESGNQNNGIFQNVTLSSDRFNNPNSAISLYGNSYVDFGDRLDVGLSDFSICAWFQIAANSLGERTIIAKSQASGADGRYAIMIHPDNKILVIFDYGGSFTNMLGVTEIQPEVWYFIAATFDRDGHLRLYLNGVLENSVDISGSINFDMQTAFPLRIGEYSLYDRFFVGSIDDVSFYDRVLSSSEVYDPSFNSVKLCSNIFCDGENVGIGTSTPDSKLTVNGTIHTKEVRVDLEGFEAPDFVFDEDYDLSTLEETSQFIQANKHLPNIPSAIEMEADGVNLKELNMILLQKIEELTLHLIRQENEIKIMKARLNKIDNQED